MTIYKQLRDQLAEAAVRNKAEGILLSGGLDTSVLALLARPGIAFTVGLQNSEAADPIYAGKVAQLLGIEHRKKEFSVAEALETLPEVIRILRTFDLALPNDLSIYFALKLAREGNVHSVITGDGSDELLAGYSYMASLSPADLIGYIRRLSENWHFSASELGQALDVQVKQPFLDEQFIHFALDISPMLKVKDGTGKYILRKSFEGLLPPEIIWRRKDTIEYGSGSSRLHEVIASIVPDEEWQSAQEKTGIRFINREHLFYYRIYSEVVGEIPEARSGEQKCPCCGAGIGRCHCPVCGFSRPLKECL